MSPTLTTFFFEAANFLVLSAVLGWVFFNPVRQALTDYRARLDATAREADQKQAVVEQARAELDHQRQELHDELTRLRSQMLESARKDADKIVSEAREHGQNLKLTAQQSVARLSEVQAATLSHAAAVAAGKAVGRLLEQINGPPLSDALVRGACHQLRALVLNGCPVTVESAAPLSDENRAEIDAALESAAATAKRRVVPGLGGGVRITTDRGVVDATIAGLTEFAQRALAAELERQAAKEVSNGG